MKWNMKTIVLKNRFAALAAVLAGIMALTSCEEHRINESRLPDSAQEFISQYFSGESVVYAEKDRDDRTVSYSVHLSDGTEIDFDEDGVWTSVDCNFSPIPSGIVPEPIYTHLGTYVPGGAEIFKVEKMWGGYEITIKDGRELIYDAEGVFVREDR